MNRKPVDYKQYDRRWASTPYNGKGETDKTIKSSGCGPTCAAMVIATLADKTVTPVETCAWSAQHGYKYANQGTAYSYFVPQLREYGIECRQLLTSRIIHKPDHEIHDKVKDYLNQGYYVIALMGPGLWTSGGHYVLLWGWDDKVRINDSYSTKSARLNGDPDRFRDEVRMYWLVDARAYNTQGDDEDMTDEKFAEMMTTYLKNLQQKSGSTWSEADRKWALENGIVKGNQDGNAMWCSFITREQMATMLHRYGQLR